MDISKCRCDSYHALGIEIRDRVYLWTGVPVTVGIARTKTLAKVANHIAKNSEKAAGVLDLTDSPYTDVALERTPMEEVWGIGPAYAKLLRERGITTALALRDVDNRWARAAMTVVGARIVMELRGVSCLPLETCPPPRKSVSCSRSFPIAVNCIDELREAVSVFVTRAAERLRRHGLAASAVTISIRTSPHGEGAEYNRPATVEMIYPTDSTQELLQSALEALERVFRKGYDYRSTGVVLTGLVPANHLTGRLFDSETMERFRRMMPVVDRLNQKFGRDTVRWGRANQNGRWKTKAARTSPHYMTRLSDVPTLY
jgi:DNA polymerase V